MTESGNIARSKEGLEIKSLISWYAFYCFIMLITGCASTGGRLGSTIPEKAKLTGLEWRPTMNVSDLDTSAAALFRSVTVTITAFEDVRENVSVIGKTPEDMRVRDTYLPVATKRNVGKWSTDALRKSLSVMGIPIAAKKGQLLLEIDLTEIIINDDITQTGKIGLRVSARTADEMLVWEGRIQGSSDLYSKPKGSDGISECLSNTMLMTLENLIREQSFRDAVTKSFDLGK